MMKNLLFALYFSPFLLQGQETCSGIENRSIFHANRIGASFSPQGSKFLPGYDYFKVPYTSENAPYTLFASSPWIGGYRNGELGLSAQRYMEDMKFDFYTGPLLEDAMTLDETCYQYNKIWISNRHDILRHIEDFALDGEISDTIESVFAWPAEGNSFFSEFNGFELPAPHHGGWADFSDQNGNGVYEPQLGEYPCIYVNGLKHIPEEVMWMVFNDQGPHTASGGLPLGVEIQLTVFAFNCQDNTVLNNALFNNYKIINQNSVPLDSVNFGMWADYDLGCSEDDYAGCDTTRNTEYVYNRYATDGDTGGKCIAGLTSYGDFPPIQSLTYLSHRMSSFLLAPLENIINPYPSLYPYPYLPAEYYNLLNGVWRDSTPITQFGIGYNPGSSYPSTKFLFPGDPRDPSQWSQNNFSHHFADPSTLSSVYLGHLLPYEPLTIETVYLFHQDSSLNHIEQVGFMHYQIDSLVQLLKDTILPCTGYPNCEGEDCVWPGDFNHNGIADHYDLLYWGVMKDQSGPARDGKINWEGHHADDWTLTLPDLLNAKHGDGNGNARVNEEDLDRNVHHFLLTNPYYVPENKYPVGPEIVISSYPMDEEGRIRNIKIKAGIPLGNILGMAYELDYDTSIFRLQTFRITNCPADSNILCLFEDEYNPQEVYPYQSDRYGFVKTDHMPFNIAAGYLFERTFNGLELKSGIAYDEIPDTVMIRLKNLIALDAEGNDLQIGSNPLVLVKPEIVGTKALYATSSGVYPNPCQGEIVVYSEVESDIEIVNIQGRKLRTISYFDTHQPVQVSDLVPGVYFLRFLQTGDMVKLIVQ